MSTVKIKVSLGIVQGSEYVHDSEDVQGSEEVQCSKNVQCSEDVLGSEDVNIRRFPMIRLCPRVLENAQTI